MIDLAAITADKGNLNVVSDAGVAVLSAYAGLRSAALNVYVNAKGLEDRDFADERLKELEGLLSEAGALTEQDLRGGEGEGELTRAARGPRAGKASIVEAGCILPRPRCFSVCCVAASNSICVAIAKKSS